MLHRTTFEWIGFLCYTKQEINMAVFIIILLAKTIQYIVFTKFKKNIYVLIDLSSQTMFVCVMN